LAAVRQIGDQGTDAGMVKRLEVDIEKVVALALQMRQDMPASLAGSPGEYHALASHFRFPSVVDGMVETYCDPAGSCRRPEIPDAVEGHGNDDERADKGTLPERADAQQAETVTHHLA